MGIINWKKWAQLWTLAYGFWLLLCVNGSAFRPETKMTANQNMVLFDAGNSKNRKAEQTPSRIALTFDDGPHPDSTERLLDGLRDRGVKASFFLIGSCAEEYPDLLKRIWEEGHLIGNHTYHHVKLSDLPEQEAEEEILAVNRFIQSITGEPVEFVRPPFGEWREDLEMKLEVMPVMWTIDPLDWTTENTDEIVDRVVTEAEENDIILLHDCYESSVDAAFRIVDILKAQGYEFVTADRLLID